MELSQEMSLASKVAVDGEARTEKFKATIEKTKQKIKEFREGDRKNKVVEKAREVGNWVEDRGNDIENFVDNTKDGIKEAINIGVENVQMKYEQTRERITTTYTETKTSLSNEVKKGKDNLVKAWRRVQAVPVDIKVSKDQKDAVKNFEKMQKFKDRYERSDSSIAKGMEKSKQLKGTSSELRRAMA